MKDMILVACWMAAMAFKQLVICSVYGMSDMSLLLYCVRLAWCVA